MRTLMKVTIPVEKGNQAITSGRLPVVVQKTMEAIKPEAAYFFADNGKRHALMVFDMKAASDIPVILEPLFLELNAEIELMPVMSAQDLQTGLGQLGSTLNR